MEAEMEDAFDVEEVCGDGGGDFESLEVDFDYEFDAFRYFDFSRAESPAEAREAERWFETAGSYPPSPFVAKIIMGKDFLKDNVTTSPKLKGVGEAGCFGSHSEIESSFTAADGHYNGWSLHDRLPCDISETDWKSIAKGPFLRCSTLMKPTASQLAKQNCQLELKSSRLFVHQPQFQQFPIQKNGRNHGDHPDNGSQAPKRQKLEGGYLHKVQIFEVKQEPNLLHKIPQKKKEPAPCYSEKPRLKLTIPREPELETARRARRIRPTISKEQQEHAVPTAAYVFKARPLNRKILEAPSLPLHQKSTPQLPAFQEFHLRTSERAIQHSHASSSSTSSSIDATRMKSSQHQASVPLQSVKMHFNNDKMLDGREKTLPKFKAHPLNKKILASKGDMGVFRSSKRETTKPKGFTFSTDKRCQPPPPTELFNKLSLAPDAQQSSTSQTEFPLPPSPLSLKEDSKENILNPRQNEHKILYVSKEKQLKVGRSLIYLEKDGMPNDLRRRPITCSRSMGIR